MNVAMMDLICVECGRRRSSLECARRPEPRSLAPAMAFEPEARDEGQIEQIERSFGRDWKW